MRTLPEARQQGSRHERVPDAARVFKPREMRFLEMLFGRLLGMLILAFALPGMAILALLIWLSDRRTPLFWQSRAGKEGRAFRMVKLRSMRVDADPYMVKPVDSDPVITGIGRMIRRRAIDEWAQLLNIVRGEMALVGPRPEMSFIVDEYDDVERMRLSVRPGLTGLWQLSRVRDRAIHHHIEYDLFYVYNRTFGMDIWLLWRTLLFALFGTGTKIRLAVRRWERDTTWRSMVPERSKAIPRRTGPHLGKVWTASASGLLVLVVALGIVLGLSARRDLLEAKAAMLDSRDAIRELRRAEAARLIGVAENKLENARTKLDSPVLIPAYLVPGVRQNLQATSAITAAGLDLVSAGKAGLKAMRVLPIQQEGLAAVVLDGSIDLTPLVSANPLAQVMGSEVQAAERKVEPSDSRLLIPQVRSARAEMLSILEEAAREVDVAAAASFLIPRMLGSERPRTWVIAAENIAEPRGRGGYLGSLAFLTASEGKISLGEFSATSDLPPLTGNNSGLPAEYLAHYQSIGALEAWQNLAMSPHYPSGARVMLRRLEEAAIVKADGIISLDPVALSYLLKATGPVHVEGRAEPLDENNFVDWALNGQYFEFQAKNPTDKSKASPTALRREEMAEVADTIWKKVLSGEGIDPKALAKAIGRALSERRMALYSSDPTEQALIERLGVSGAVSQKSGDYLMVVGQNFGENKMDYYLHRSISYSGKIDTSGTLTANLKVEVANTAPAGIKYPSHVGAPRPDLGLGPGEARSYLEIFVPRRAELSSVIIDGKLSKDFEVKEELGKKVLITTVTLGPGANRSIEYSYTFPGALNEGEYRLVLQNQSTVRPDRLSVDISLPENVEIGDREVFIRGSKLKWQGELVKDTELAAEISVPWHLRIAGKVSNWLNKPAIKIGER